MNKIAGPFVVSFDSKDMPGKVRVLYVTFHEEIATLDQAFEKREFQLLDPKSPHVATLAGVLAK